MPEGEKFVRIRLPYAAAVATSVVAFVVALALWIRIGGLPGGCAHVQSAASLAGSSARFDDYVNSGRHPGATCVNTTLASVHDALWLNALLGLVVTLLTFVLLVLWLRRAVFTGPVRTWVWRFSFLPLVAGALNLVQVGLSFAGIYRLPGGASGFGLHSWAARLLPIVAWPKLVFFAVGVLVLGVAVVSARGNVLEGFVPLKVGVPKQGFAASATRIRPLNAVWRFFSTHLHFLENPRDVEPVVEPPPPVAGLGISCSGGGIRAASVALGVLSSLEGHRVDGAPIADGAFDGRSSILDGAKYVASVSGGGYTAGAWRIAHGVGAVPPDFESNWPRGIIGDPWKELDRAAGGLRR